jgi:hypothetical protein
LPTQSGRIGTQSLGEPGGASSRSVIYNVTKRSRSHAINVRSHSCKAALTHSGSTPQHFDSSNRRQTGPS